MDTSHPIQYLGGRSVGRVLSCTVAMWTVNTAELLHWILIVGSLTEQTLLWYCCVLSERSVTSFHQLPFLVFIRLFLLNISLFTGSYGNGFAFFRRMRYRFYVGFVFVFLLFVEFITCLHIYEAMVSFVDSSTENIDGSSVVFCFIFLFYFNVSLNNDQRCLVVNVV